MYWTTLECRRDHIYDHNSYLLHRKEYIIDQSPDAGRASPAIPGTPDTLYDRDVRTRLYRQDPQTIRAVATLQDDSFGPGGFATVHDMKLTVDVDEASMRIETVEADMVGHPHRTCPSTLRAMDQLIGLTIGPGYFRELRERFGGNRGCNHLHTMAQHIGTVVSLSFAARVVENDTEAQALPHERWMLRVVEKEPRVIDSCAIWHRDGELATRMLGADT